MAAQLAPAEVDVVMERALAELPVETWRVVDTRRVGRGARVDMVLVGPPGIFVVGCATANESARSRSKASANLASGADNVASLVGVRRDEVYPVLCLAGGAVAADGWSRGVTTCAPSNLVETIVFRRNLLTPDEVERVAIEIGRSMRGGTGKHRA
jgi:hypothetical protein